MLLLTNISLLKSEFTFVDKIDVAITTKSLYVINKEVFFLTPDSMGLNNRLFKYSNNEFSEPYKYVLDSLKPNSNIRSLFMADTNYIVLTYSLGNYGNEILVKEKSNWTLFNQTNSDLKDDAKVYDVMFNSDGEIAIINTSVKISFVKDGEYSYKECFYDHESIPLRYFENIGLYFEGCLFYKNSDRNHVRLCNKEIDRVFTSEDFQSSSGGVFYSIHKDKLYFWNSSKLLFSLKGDEIASNTLISEDKLKEYAWDENRYMFLSSYLFGNDGYLYCLYQENVAGFPKGKSRLFKLTEEFEYIENIPLPNQVDGDFNAVFKLRKDLGDTNNKKLYITATTGFYIYDPEPTSVRNGSEISLASLYITEVYPNPASGLINIQYATDISNSSKIKMFLTNVMGQRIKEFDQIGSYNISTGYGTSMLDVSDIANGNYQLVITDGNKYVSKNILVIR